MKTLYSVHGFFKCSDDDGTFLSDVQVRADSEDAAKLKAMALHRRQWLGGDSYVDLKKQKAHLAGKPFEFKFKRPDGIVCTIWFGQVEEVSE